MPRKDPPPVDLNGLRLRSLHDRPHLVEVSRFARLPAAGSTVSEWLASLPDFLGAARFRGAVDAIVAAGRADRAVVFAFGAHVVKVGCGPVIIDLMRRGIVSAIACNGAAAIHDVEVAMIGATSEDVGESIRDGSFGMARETMAFFAKAAERGAANDAGFGRAIGEMLLASKLPHADLSVLATAARCGVPATVHVALGTDTVHMSQEADGGQIGRASLADFRRLCAVARDLGAATSDGPGGVWCNIGSAVVMPEVFLKVIAVARNLGADLDAINTVNMDMLRHYRPSQNVLARPLVKGRGFEIVGHHEIMLPLLRQAIIERLGRRE
jgi:hypothetical protein